MQQVKQSFSSLADHFIVVKIIFDGVPKLNAFFGISSERFTFLANHRLMHIMDLRQVSLFAAIDKYRYRCKDS